MFRINQKVVAVAGPKGLRPTIEAIKIKVGTVLTIRDIDMSAANCPGHEGLPTLRFEEILNARVLTMSHGPWELGYDPRYFRPVVERKTDISIFREILNREKVDA